MTEGQDSADADLITRASASWLATTAAGEAPDKWVFDLRVRWLTNWQFEYMWHFALRLCETVDPEDREIIERIGYELARVISYFPARAVQAIEDVAEHQPTIICALSIASSSSRSVEMIDSEVDDRIDAILARHGIVQNTKDRRNSIRNKRRRKDKIDPDLIERASASWLATAAADKYPDEWVENLQGEWLYTGQFEYFWRFILRLCEDADPNNKEIVDKIGVDPIVSLMLEFPDQTLQAIEDVAEQQPTLINALTIVMGGSEKADARIDEILARYGKPRQ